MTKARTLADNFAADINGITAGTGITGGGTSGTVTITNDMATTIAAKGDLLAGTANDAYAALTVGANDTVLTADSSTATGLKWAAVASGGMTLLASGTLSGTTVSLTSIPGTYENLIIYMRDVTGTAVNSANLQVNSNGVVRAVEERNLTGVYQVQTTTSHSIFQNMATTNTDAHAFIFIPDYSSSSVALAQSHSYINSGGQTYLGVRSVFPATTTAITSVQLDAPAGFSGGTYELWGQK